MEGTESVTTIAIKWDDFPIRLSCMSDEELLEMSGKIADDYRQKYGRSFAEDLCHEAEKE